MSDYDYAKQEYAADAPSVVDSNGVRTSVPVPDQIASPAQTVHFVSQGSSTQITDAAPVKRTVVLQNMGTVPVYITPNGTISYFPTVSSYGVDTVPIGAPLHAGDTVTYVTSLALFASVRLFSGTQGLVGVTI